MKINMSLISVPDEGSKHFQDRNDHPGEDHADLFLQINNYHTKEDLHSIDQPVEGHDNHFL